MFSREFLLDLFDYDRERGVLIWKNPPKQNCYLIGKEVDFVDETGCVIVGISNKIHKVHRIIHFIETGTWPKMIDHINGIRTDNRRVNLRGVDSRENQQNQKRHRDGRLVGASFHKFSQQWRATIKVDKKAIHLGYFKTELEAHNRYKSELKERGLLV